MSRLNAQLDKIEARFAEIEQLLADPVVLANYSRMNELAQERSELEDLVEAYQRSKIVEKQLAENQLLLEDRTGISVSWPHWRLRRWKQNKKRWSGK
jgi:peptide chain release factor 1